jgi:peptidyl-dipeptidase A
MLEEKLSEFIKEHENLTKDLRYKLYLSSWNFETTGKEEWKNKKVEAEISLTKIYANKQKYNQLKDFYENIDQIKDEKLKRQLVLFVNAFESEQKDDDLIEKTVNLSADINDKYNNFRGSIDGKKVNDNQILEILQESEDNELRKKAWEASKEIGKQVYRQIIDLVKLRNESAKRLGYKNYYYMSLKIDEIHYDKLFKTLEHLKELTDEPFRKEKSKLDNYLAKRFKISTENLRPWHYADPFFQEAPSHDKVNVDHFFKDKDVIDLNKKFYDGIGLEVRDILERSDLYAREGKSQHAFCIDIDKEGDIRILCNIIPNEKWVSTTLHELGHAVYDKYIDRELPFYLRAPSHTMTTEAVAMLMGRLTKSERWLKEIAEVLDKELKEIHPFIKEHSKLAMLIFVRWGLVMVNFERELYNNPDQDLNTLWWDLVEKYQFVKRPENRNEPDWASKIHIALAPVYYQNYILGELIASQLGYYIHQLPGGHITSNINTGKFLKEKLFRYGALYDWNKSLEVATGEKLNPKYFVDEFING